jgi:hypothetical protein
MALPSAAGAAGSRLGPSITAINTWSRGSAVAYDSKNSVYLVVSAFGSGPLRGRFVTADGALVGTEFLVQPLGDTHFPQLAYSPDANAGAGGFLVTWHQTESFGATPHARLVSYVAGNPVIGADLLLAPEGSFWEQAAHVAYSTTSREFLVTWRGPGIRAQRVSILGTKLGGLIPVTATPNYRDPSVAYNPNTNEFLIVFSGWDNTSALVSARRIAAGTGALLGAETLIQRASGTYITELSYNPATNRFLAAWYQPGGTFGRVLDAAGNPVTGIMTLSTRFTAYDGLGLDYNTQSGTFMMVSQDQLGYQNGAVELSANGVPDGIGFIATDTVTNRGNFYPQIAARSNAPQFLMSTATSFAVTTVQRLQSSATSGPGAATLRSPLGIIGSPVPTFIWNPVSGATYYQLYVNDGSGQTRVKQWYTAQAIGCASGTCATNPDIPLTTGAGAWWVQAWSPAGYGPWSAPGHFTLLPLPNGLALISPQGLLAQTTPTFTWSASSVATHYQLFVTDSIRGGRIDKWYTFVEAGCATGTGTCTVSPGVELSAGWGLWWVRAWNVRGYGPWSNGISIGVPWRPPSAISAVTETKPYVRYKWRAANGATLYQLFVRDSHGVNRIDQWYTASEAGCSGGATCEVVAWAAAMAAGDATVWVRAWNPNPAAPYSPWSSPAVFTY